MIYYDFKNYEEFKELFGIVEHANGTKSRKNKILLSVYKDKEALKRHIASKERISLDTMYDKFHRRARRIEVRTCVQNYCKVVRTADAYYERLRKIERRLEKVYDFMDCTCMSSLKNYVFDCLTDCYLYDSFYVMELNGRRFMSTKYETDHMRGLCEDGTLNAIRYVNKENDRVFKMKAGKMVNHLIAENPVARNLPEQVKRWFSEEFVADWVEYARENLGTGGYTLHVDGDFAKIYRQSSLKGDFNSCMVNRDTFYFYENAVKAKAAYLTDGNGMVVARCVIYTDVSDNDGNTLRLAERQYSVNGDLTLKRQLVNALIAGGHIDGYKVVGAGCSDMRAWVDNDGNTLPKLRLSISCNLEDGDTVSYQDSFKFFDYEEQRAYNYEPYDDMYDLATTDGSISIGSDDDEDYVWSDYHEQDIPQDDAVFVDTRNSYFYENECVEARVYSYAHNRFYTERCYAHDVIEIGHEYYFAGEDAESPYDWGLSFCERCEDYYVSEDGFYSELTEEWYCCEFCRDDAERDWYEDHGYEWSNFEDKWIEPGEVLHVRNWHSYYHCYVDSSCSVDFFNNLAEQGKATEYMGEFYIDKVMYDGEPAHLGCERKIA